MKKSCMFLSIIALNCIAASFCFCQDKSFKGKAPSKMINWQSTTKDGYLKTSYDSFKGTTRGLAFRAEKGSAVSYQYICQMDSGQLDLLLVQSNDEIVWNDKIDSSNSANNPRDISIPIKNTDFYRIVIAGDSKRGSWEIRRVDNGGN